MVAHKNSAQQEETCPTSPLGLSARSHVAHQLTSSYTLDRSRYLRSQISSGYITTRLHHHSTTSPLDLSARSHVPHLDEFVYSGQVTLPEESDQLRLHCLSATSPLGLSTRSHIAHLDEFVYSGQVTLPEESDQLRLHCHSSTSPLGLSA